MFRSRVACALVRAALRKLINKVYSGVLITKPTRRINFSNLFWNKTLHVSDSSSVSHQECFTVHTAMVYVVQVCWQLASCQQSCTTYTIAVCTVKHSWWLTEELSKTCRILFQNKFDKLVHLVGFVIIIYHDKRSPEPYTLRIWCFHSGGSDDSDLLEYEAVSEQLTLTRRHIFVSQKIWNLKDQLILTGTGILKIWECLKQEGKYFIQDKCE